MFFEVSSLTYHSPITIALRIAGEWAIGLERLLRPAIDAIADLLVSTFLTMVDVPVLCSLFEDLERFVRREEQAVPGVAPAHV